MATTTTPSPKKTPGESETSPLDQPFTRLESRIGAGIPQPATATQPQKPFENVSTNILMVKTLVKGMVKACVQEEVDRKQAAAVIDALVENYRHKYPFLTQSGGEVVSLVINGIARHKKSLGETSDKFSGDESDKDDSDDEVGRIVTTKNTVDDNLKTIERCIGVVEDHIAEYALRIEALKKRRKSDLESTKPSKKRQGEPSPKAAFTRGGGIDSRTFGNHTRNYPAKRCTGHNEIAEFLIQKTIKAGSDNNGYSTNMIESLAQLQPEIGLEQAKKYIHRILKKEVAELLKKKPQESTSSMRYQRTNHSKDDSMKEAVEEWDRLKGNGVAPTKAAFARERGLSSSTFKKYVHDDPTKRRQIGGRAGKKSIVSDENAEFLIQQTIVADCANNGDINATTSEMVDSLMQLQPELDINQAKSFIRGKLMNDVEDRLKKPPVQALLDELKNQTMKYNTRPLID